MRTITHTPARRILLYLFLPPCLVASTPLQGQFGAIGLSGVGAQRFANEDLLFFEPQAGDHFGAAFAAGDFDGDGADDLATGMPHDDGIVGFEIADCGAVVVRYGAPGTGLEPGLADTLLNQIGGGVPDPAEAGDEFGVALAACNFNGDDFVDLAVGIRSEDLGGEVDAGAVQIYYGSETGLVNAGAQFLTQDSGSVPGEAEEFEKFGSSLACGRFDGDIYDDLAIGVPSETFEVTVGPNLVWVGMVDVIYGSPGGLNPADAQSLHQDVEAMDGASEQGDMFGAALVVGNFDSDETDDLAIGIPGEDGGGFSSGRGAVQVVLGNSEHGLMPSQNLLYTEDELGDVPQDGDRLGFALAAGDFDGDQFTDLAVGVPFDPLQGIANAGQVFVMYGAVSPPFDLGRTQRWFEDVIHFPGTSEAGDLFGRALAAGDFDHDGRDDLAIGEPGEFVLVPEDGMVTVIMGAAGGLSNARRHGLSAGYHGNPGQANQSLRHYGFAVVSGDFDGDDYADLAIGAPDENEGGIVDVGAVVAFYGSLFADGFAVENTGFWSSHVP